MSSFPAVVIILLLPSCVVPFVAPSLAPTVMMMVAPAVVLGVRLSSLRQGVAVAIAAAHVAEEEEAARTPSPAAANGAGPASSAWKLASVCRPTYPGRRLGRWPRAPRAAGLRKVTASRKRGAPPSARLGRPACSTRMSKTTASPAFRWALRAPAAAALASMALFAGPPASYRARSGVCRCVPGRKSVPPMGTSTSCRATKAQKRPGVAWNGVSAWTSCRAAPGSVLREHQSYSWGSTPLAAPQSSPNKSASWLPFPSNSRAAVTMGPTPSAPSSWASRSQKGRSI
mmetsp:Transcript_38460/g.56514  ORF Transcript_38460/g.56514 Transcript_38460/m.56514 type:complete len:286 (+) Transcript_38460:226-1083(+)